MAPKDADSVRVLADENEIKSEVGDIVTHLQEPTAENGEPMQIVWRNVIWFIILHAGALYGMFLIPWLHPYTWIWTIVSYTWGAWGVTAGAHRLWAHRSYKAKMPLRILLAIWNSMAFQNDVIEWSRDHRMHHKFSETNADPHNAARGFFFAHCGWLMCRKHPAVKAKGNQIDLSDLLNDPVLKVQRKYYLLSVALFCFAFPAVVPWYFWGESGWNAYFTCSLFRYALSLNFTWCVNSVAHMWGNKPFDKHINPVENPLVVFGAVGEGFHNYHHTFPFDYATSELGGSWNMTTMFIDSMAWIGQAYDRKRVSNDAIAKRKLRTGDGTKFFGYGQKAN